MGIEEPIHKPMILLGLLHLHATFSATPDPDHNFQILYGKKQFCGFKLKYSDTDPGPIKAQRLGNQN